MTQQHPPIEADLIGAGGGSNIVSLAAMAYRLAKRTRFVRVGGTSAFSLVSVAIAFGVPESRLIEVLKEELTGDKLLDANPVNVPLRFGVCGGDALRRAITKLIGNRTMGEAKIPFFVMVGDLYFGEPLQVSSWEHPNVLVADAATASSAIPGIFAMQEIRGGPWGNRKFVDGGTAVNFAMDRYDDVPERATIGLRCKSTREAKPVRSWDFVAWGKALARLLMHSSDNAHLSGKNFSRIIEGPQFDGLDFSLSAAEVDARWKAGVIAAERWLAITP